MFSIDLLYSLGGIPYTLAIALMTCASVPKHTPFEANMAGKEILSMRPMLIIFMCVKIPFLREWNCIACLICDIRIEW
jgi:hypothetical protein